MTRVCCSCGWLVTNGRERCSCGGIAVSFKAAKKALSVSRYFDVLMASPERRARALSARAR